jgi:hypothetical protein
VPQPPKPEFSRLNTHNGATQRSKCPACTHCALRLLLVLLHGHFMPLQEARRSPHGRRYMCFTAAPGMLLGRGGCSGGAMGGRE